MEISFVGCGEVAHFHIQVLHHLGLKVVSVCGREDSENAKAFAKQYAISRVYPSWQELLANEKPDAFWVIPDWKEIHHLLTPFIERGIPCFFEKPVALTSKRIQEAIHICNKYKTKILIGYNRRFYDFITEVKDFIASHKILSVEVHIPEFISRYTQQNDFEKIKNLWIYNSSHVLDLLYYLIGDVEISLLYKKNDENIGLPTSFNGMLQAARYNFPIHLVANWDTPGNFEIIFHCKEYLIKLSPLERMQIYYGMQISEPTPQCPIRIFSPTLVREVYADTRFKPGFLQQAQNFIDTCILGKYQNSKGATLEDALKITSLCEKIQNGQD